MCCEYFSIWFTFVSFCNLHSVSDLALLPTPLAVCCLAVLCDGSFGSCLELFSSLWYLYSWLAQLFKSQLKMHFWVILSHSLPIYIYTYIYLLSENILMLDAIHLLCLVCHLFIFFPPAKCIILLQEMFVNT